MNQIQFLILLIATIPLLNCLLLKIYSHNFIDKFCVILFFVSLIGIHAKLDEAPSYLSLIKIFPNVSLGFFIDRIALGFLFLLSFIWIIFIFYSQRFLQLSPIKNEHNFRIFFTLIIAFATLSIISKNLLTLLLFYNLLILLCYFFVSNFLHKSESKFSRLFIFLLYLESAFFFLAAVATYKFSGSIEFSSKAIIAENFDLNNYRLVFLFYCCGLFLSTLAPFYLFYRTNINLEPLFLYVFFFLGYALVSLFIFLRILSSIFDVTSFSAILGEVGFGFFEIVFLSNMLLASGFLIFSRGIKASFFYLFFQQFTFTLFAIFFFEKFAVIRVYLPLLSFLLGFTLCFLTISNLALYLTRAQDKQLDGIFYRLTITCSLLLFALANMAGIAPAVGLIEKFFIFKIILEKDLWISLAILLVNFIGVAAFSYKIFRPLFSRQIKNISEDDIAIAKNIDFDSNLILTGLVVAILMFLGAIGLTQNFASL